MKILLCTPYDLCAPAGNSIAVRRLEHQFSARGHIVHVLSDCERTTEHTAAECCRFFDPDVSVVMHAWRCAKAFRGIKSATRAPIIVSLRGTDINEMIKDPQKGPVVRSVLDSCNAITVFSEAMSKDLLSHSPAYSSKLFIISNGLDLPSSGIDYRRRMGLPQDHQIFVGLAGIRAVKRIPWIVEMLVRVRAHHRNLLYVHAGPVWEEEEHVFIERLIHTYPWFRYVGSVPHEEVDSFLRAGDLFVSASRSEGMPHAVREAMGVGLPVLLSDIAAYRTIALDEQEALFFSDEATFVAQALRLIRDREFRTRLGTAAQQRTRDSLEHNGEIDSYIDLFARVMAHGSSRGFEEQRRGGTRSG